MQGGGPSTPFDKLRDRPSTPFDRPFDRPFDKLRDHSGTAQGPPFDKLRDHGRRFVLRVQKLPQTFRESFAGEHAVYILHAVIGGYIDLYRAVILRLQTVGES